MIKLLKGANWHKEKRESRKKRGMASNVREQRRRRIMERGSDRLALITGQIKDIHESPAPAPSTSTYRHTHTESSPPITPFDLSDVSEHGSEVQKKMAYTGFPEKNNVARKIEPLLRKCVTSTETTRTPEIDGFNKTVTSGDRVKPPKGLNQIRLFSSKRINASIIASERKRAICSLIVACLVVVSYFDYPLFGVNLVSSESFIVSRPVYIILLTDVTIVLARLFRDRGNDSEEAQEEKMAGKYGDNWTDAFKLLERGLVAYQAIRGIFIDFSIYLVVVTCGLSLV